MFTFAKVAKFRKIWPHWTLCRLRSEQNDKTVLHRPSWPQVRYFCTDKSDREIIVRKRDANKVECSCCGIPNCSGGFFFSQQSSILIFTDFISLVHRRTHCRTHLYTHTYTHTHTHSETSTLALSCTISQSSESLESFKKYFHHFSRRWQ